MIFSDSAFDCSLSEPDFLGMFVRFPSALFFSEEPELLDPRRYLVVLQRLGLSPKSYSRISLPVLKQILFLYRLLGPRESRVFTRSKFG
jgi:hypothetical protein